MQKDLLSDDKPMSMSIKQWLIRKMSLKTMTPESVIEAVVNHQCNSALNAMGECNSLELSGFGKFFFNVKKAKWWIERFDAMEKILKGVVENPESSSLKVASANAKLKSLAKDRELLIQRVKE